MNLDVSGYGLISIAETKQNLLNNFDCGIENLNSFLKEEAKSFQDGRISNTYCVFHKDYDGIIGYFSLSNTSINFETSEVMDLGLNITTPINAIPAVLIGKFAIKKDLQKCGNGKNVLDLAISQVADSSSPSCARLLVVDSIQEAVGFYTQCSFKHSIYAIKKINQNKKNRKKNLPQTIKMFLDLLD